MKVNKTWRGLGWRHPLWDFIRFFSVVKRQKKELRQQWIEKLETSHMLEIDSSNNLPVDPAHVKLFFGYLKQREADVHHASDLLRSEIDALAHCNNLGIAVSKVKTKSTDHHQSSSALVAATSHIVSRVCQKKGLTYSIQPDRRCVWLVNNHLHVTARNLDGAIHSLSTPSVIWEIKEYWGKTKGGSKMSDAVYECNLVGRELCEFEERSGARVAHVVFVDGKEQWSHRVSDLVRFIDLFHQGIIDYLFIGRDVESDWETVLKSLLHN